MARSEHTASPSLGALAPDPEQYAYTIPELAQTRAYATYASQILEQSPEAAAARAVANLREHGFAVLDTIIPPEQTEAVRLEVEQVTLAVGETVKCHSAAPPSPFSRCFDTDGKGVSAE